MNKTKIEWVKNPDGSQGYTWNPITGCLNHVNGLCNGGNFPCYAYKLANGRLKQRYLANENRGLPAITPGHSEVYRAALDRSNRDPFYPRFWGDRLSKPVESPTPQNPAKRKGIFVCDMSDLFGIGIPEIWTEQVMTTIKLCPYHRFYLLTKQPQNLIKWSPFPENCWVGVTATDYWKYVDACNYLSQVKANVKFLSLEPLLSWDENPQHFFKGSDISWLIIGQQTPVSAKTQPKIEWVREIVAAADRAGIRVFLKDNLLPCFGGYPVPKDNIFAYRFSDGAFILRQEMPGD
ncbi:MAG: phage Gp37/Gp68 family protein [Dehalococcoidia bacterium]|nr:phage Gp37/Gp68 family protein [Dehalococcoidia bacterium]